MLDSKNHGINIKGRRLAVFGIKSFPNIMWLVFDEPCGYNKDEQDRTCKTYHYNDKLQAMATYQKLVTAYKKSPKYHYDKPYKFVK